MQKTLLRLSALAALSTGLFLGATAQAQPMPNQHPPYAEPPHMRPAPMHRKHKVWVPAHREHGRLMRGHYVWR